jgi:hypothetical protein
MLKLKSTTRRLFLVLAATNVLVFNFRCDATTCKYEERDYCTTL